MAPVGERLSELLGGALVRQAPAVVGEDVETMAGGLGAGDVLLLENVRFEAGETDDDPILAEQLAALADVYVNDAFGAAHRAHASTAGVAAHLPGYAGLLLETRGHRADPGGRVPRASAGRRPRRRQGQRQGRGDRPLPRRSPTRS